MIEEAIARLKERENAVILAHYYVDGAVQALADFVGDSYYLAKVASRTDKDTIVFCGVRFMGESAKILNPSRRVLLPDAFADCPMAHMANRAQIAEMRAKIPDLAVVCYINSTAELKALSDVCVTSSNAIRIVSALPNRNILFIPDENLGAFVRSKVPDKTFYFSGGYCPVHAQLLAADIDSERAAHPDAPVLAHPECRADVLARADFIGSTAEILAFAQSDGAHAYILATEPGVLYELNARCPGKKFYPVTPICADMKRITPEGVLRCLERGEYLVEMSSDRMAEARRPLERMLELAQ